MGFAICYGTCVVCNLPFSFNPVRVPSLRIRGNREPICKNCIERANTKRKETGMEPIEVHKDAYNPCDEVEL